MLFREQSRCADLLDVHQHLRWGQIRVEAVSLSLLERRNPVGKPTNLSVG